MSLNDLDPLLQPPKRLAVLGVLANNLEVEFAFLRTLLELSDSDLSKQMSVLVKADYAASRKVGKGRNRQTWYKITSTGKESLQQHIVALNMLIEQAPSAPQAN